MADDITDGGDKGGEIEPLPLTPEESAAKAVQHPVAPPPPPPPPTNLPKAPPLNEAAPAQIAPDGSVLAGYWIRVLGYIIDGILVAIVVGVLALGLFRHSGSLPIYLGLLVELIYATVLIAKWEGQTIGMKVVKVRCIDATNGEAVEWGKSFGRAAIHAVLGIIPIIGLVDLLWPAWDKKNQTLHDKVASTVVVKVSA